MADYIEREALMNYCAKIVTTVEVLIGPDEMPCVKQPTKHPVQLYDHVQRAIRHAPAADVAPVVHGRWVETTVDTFGSVKHICSECGKYRLYSWSDYKECNYCPNCGAKMDLKEET